MNRIYLSPPEVGPTERDAVLGVLDSGWVAPAGPHLTAFEEAMARVTGVPHAVALGSGTAALHLALLVLGVGRGDEVFCPTLTFAASANPVRYCGAEPVFIDCEERSWNLDPGLLEEALKSRAAAGRLPRALILVHLYGQCADVDAILPLARKYGVPVIEDAAEALGASHRGHPAGSFGDLSFVSFNGNKIITTSGGGMLLSSRAEWIDRARFLATQAREPFIHYEHREIGYNYRLSNLLAGLGLAQLADLDRRVAVRRGHFEAYRSVLGGCPGVRMMPVRDWGEPNYWLSCLTLDRDQAKAGRDDLIAALERADIEARPLWKPLHLQPVYREAACFGGGVAERLFETGLCLPSGSGMTADERDRVLACLLEALNPDG